MAVTAELEDLDQRFKNACLNGKPVVINDASKLDDEIMERLINYSTEDVLTSVPSCACGASTGQDRLGDMCQVCGTVVNESTATNNIEIGWIRAPKGVRSLINLTFLTCLIHDLQKNKSPDQCTVSWVINPLSRPQKETLPMVRWRDEFGMQRGLNYFIDNFDTCMHTLYLVHNKDYDKSTMKLLVNTYRHVLFPQYTPILGKSFLIIEKNATGAYTGNGLSLIVDAINLLSGIDADADIIKNSQKNIESKTAKALLNIVYYRLENMRVDLFKKHSLARSHIHGTRTHFTMRTVVTSITGVHEYDVIHLPWGPSVVMLRLHISNILLKRGYIPTQIEKIIGESIGNYNPIIHSIIEELRSMSQSGYFDVLMLRNPTLGSGSIQRLKAIVKTNPRDMTISHPIMNVRLFNMDFDGDECPVTLLIDDVARTCTELLKPHYAYMQIKEYGCLSDAFDFTKPTAAIVRNYMCDQTDNTPIDEELLRLIEAK